MINVIKKIFGFKYKEAKPVFPSTFLFPDYVYKQWNNKLKAQGWTKEEIRQGWRWTSD